MKFFSECFYGGGATVTPAADTTVSLSSSTKTGSRRNCSGGISRPPASAAASNTSRNWKPKLQVISEDSVMMMPRDSSRAVGSDDKLSVKVKAKSKPKAPRATHGDDYW